MTTTDARGEDNYPSKSTLFCPDCGHQSPYDGDWHVVETTRKTQTRCPECRAEVNVRPAIRAKASQRGPAALVERWHDGVLTWQRLWWKAMGGS